MVVCQLDKVYFYETNANNEEYKYNPLLVESNIMSCSFEQQTRHLLISTRQSQKCPRVRHLVYEMAHQNASSTEAAADYSSSSSYSMNLIQTFQGSTEQKMLAKSKLYSLDASELYACASDEPTRCLNIWSVNRNELACKLNNASEVLDSCSIRLENNHVDYLCSLTDKQLRIFKKTSSNK